MTMSTVIRSSERSQLAARLRLVVTRLNRRLRAQADSGLTASAMAALAAIDRRGARVALTAKGRLRLQQSRTRKTAYLAAQLEALEPDELRVLEEAAAILERLLDGAR